jgi:hypothetical protein
MTRRFFSKLLLVVVAVFGLLVLSSMLSAQGRSQDAFERVREVQERHTDRLMAIDGVEGTAVGLDESDRPAVKVFLENPGVRGIPTELDGVPVHPVVTGKIYALPKPPTPSAKPTKNPPAAPTGLTATEISSSQINLSWTDNATNETGFRIERKTTGSFSQIATVGANVTTYSNTGLNSSTTYTYRVRAYNNAGTSAYSNEASATTRAGEVSPYPRPARIGISTGHPNITAGTIGCRVTKNGNVYALSNNHVYADENRASIGDNVLQPGPYDGGQNPRDAIGTLADFQPIVFSRWANNTIDAAIALCTKATLDNRTPDDSYGTPSSTTAVASVGLAVKKHGRTTGLTPGQVYAVNATVNVGYSSGTARFVNQIMITPGGFSAGGDSGSLIVTQSGNNPVGLLFAGNSSITVANPIDAVLDAFEVTVDGEQ